MSDAARTHFLRDSGGTTTMLLEHQGKRPRIDPTAVIAPTAVVCGDVTIGPGTHVAFGAVLTAEGAPLVLGARCVVREHALLRSTAGHPLRVGDYVLIGPHAALNGCTIEDEAFLATGVSVFHDARIGRAAEVRINGVVHVRTVLPADAMVPIGWVAVGDPVRILPPEAHDEIWAVLRPLNFPALAYGLERRADGTIDMREVTRRVTTRLAEHRNDRVVSDAE
jgi:carbonic anhydrase/acetyltransferase-like protein (isoleucine patch superfamily)